MKKLNKIPSISEVNRTLSTFSTSARQFTTFRPRRYARGTENVQRIWVTVGCEKHGLYSEPIRWDSIKRYGGRCKKCGFERVASFHRKSLDEIKKIVERNASKLGMQIKVLKIIYNSRRRPKIQLYCTKHGLYETSLGHALHRSQLCAKCGFERCSSRKLISLEEKKELYYDKFPKSELEILEQQPRSFIRVRCKECKSLFSASWSNLFLSGTGCFKCAHKRRGLRSRIPVREVEKRLKEYGLILVGGYEGTHKKCQIKCKKCGTKKNIKPNSILSREKGFSCKCTQSLPDYCRDLIASDLCRIDPDVKKEDRQFIAHFKNIPDIYLPNLNIIVEVKYGNSCFGSNFGPKLRVARYKHTNKQASFYAKMPQRVVYLIVAYKKNVEFIPKFLNKFEHYFLDNIPKFTIKGESAMSAEVLKKLHQLYVAPVLVRELDLFDLPFYQLIRKKLFAFIQQNNLRYPSQKEIREKFGVSQRVVDRALGLGRNQNMACRIDVLSKKYGVVAAPVRRNYVDQNIIIITPREQQLFDQYLKLCEKFGRPLMPSELNREINVPASRVDRWLGLRTGASRIELADALKERGIRINYIPLVKELSAGELSHYANLMRKAKNLGHCVLCNNLNEKRSPLCARCHGRAKRKFNNLSRAERAIKLIQAERRG